MPNLEYINGELNRFLEKPDFKSYAPTIKEILKDSTSIEVKYNFVTLLMNLQLQRLVNDNHAERLRNFYCADENINNYVNEIVSFTPKLGWIEINSKSGRDMENKGSEGIIFKIPFNVSTEAYFQHANDRMKEIKEVLIMILMESKFINS